MRKDNDKLVELLSAYLDGEVTHSEREDVEQLLRSDPEARELYARLEKTRGLLNGLEKLQAPPTLKHRVQHQLSMSKGRRSSFFSIIREKMLPARIPVPLLTYAGAILVIGTIIVYLASTGIFFYPEGSPGTSDQLADLGYLEDSKEEKKSEDDSDTFADMQPTEAERGRRDSPAPGETDSEETAPTEDLESLADSEMALAEAPRMEARAAMAAPRAAIASERSREGGKRTFGLPGSGLTLLRASERLIDQRPGIGIAEIGEEFYVSPEETHIIEKGQPHQLDTTASAGSDKNPLFDSNDFLPPRLVFLEFIAYSGAPEQQEVPVFIQAHISQEGTIYYLRMVGNKIDRQIMKDLADRMIATRLIPARREQDWVSVFYSFEVVIRPAR